MTIRTWHSGHPPSIGWWPASVYEDPTTIRWWDGTDWSRPAWPNISATEAASRAAIKAGPKVQNQIQYCARWWL